MQRISVTTAGTKETARGFEHSLGRAAMGAMRDTSDWLKAATADQVRAAGLGNKLGTATRRTVYPTTGDSLEPALYFEARKNTNAPTLFDVFDNGATIRSRNGFWLAIPTEAAKGKGYRDRRGRMARVTPGAWERATGQRLRFIYRRGKPGLLVADNVRIDSRGRAAVNQGSSRRGGVYTRLAGRASVIMFVLVPQVTLTKRIDWTSLGVQAQARFITFLKLQALN